MNDLLDKSILLCIFSSEKSMQNIRKRNIKTWKTIVVEDTTMCYIRGAQQRVHLWVHWRDPVNSQRERGLQENDVALNQVQQKKKKTVKKFKLKVKENKDWEKIP